MELTAGATCKWTCTPDYLEIALREIEENGSTLLTVVPFLLKGKRAYAAVGFEHYEVLEYLVFYRNPSSGDL